MNRNALIDHDKLNLIDVFNLFVDDEIGQGISRTVYTLAPDLFNRPMVLKIESDPSHYRQNVAEFMLYQALSETAAGKWLAPVAYLAPNGRALLMERTWPVPQSEYPKKLPSFLTDTKYANYGRLPDGRFVCHDYGTSVEIAVGLGASAKRQRAAEWWGDDA